MAGDRQGTADKASQRKKSDTKDEGADQSIAIGSVVAKKGCGAEDTE